MHLFQLLRRAVALLAKPALLGLLVSGAASLAGRAQSPLPLVYQLRGSTLLQECNAQGQASPLLAHTAPAGAYFTIVNPVSVGGNYIIQFAQWAPPAGLPADLRVSTSTPPTSPNDSVIFYENGHVMTLTATAQMAYYESYYFNLNYNASTGQARYFLLAEAALPLCAAPLPPRLSPIGGALFIPVKLRPQDGSAAKDLTISGMAGVLYRFRRVEDLSLAVLLGPGLTAVTLTPDNSNRTSAEDRVAFTPSLAVLLQWQQLQFGLAGGFDVQGAGDANWVYNKKFWLGAGVGFSLFSPKYQVASNASANVGISPRNPGR